MTEESRSRRLGDVGANAPSRWEWGNATRVPHLMVMLLAEPGRLDTFIRNVTGRPWNEAFEELRWLGGTLGPARNLDVFAAELVPAARTGLPEEPGWEDLAAALDRLRGAAYEQIREALLSRRYTVSMLRLLRWFEASGWRRHSAGSPRL